MKTITETNAVMHVVSEPGDMTLYDYFVYQDHDDFMFMPGKSTFKFPQKLNYWDIEDIETWQDATKLNIDVNPHTLLECIRTIKEMI